MTKEESLSVCAHIGNVIAQYAPNISYTARDLEKARAGYSDEKLQQLKEEGYYFDDFELFYVMLRFCDGMDLWKRADAAFLKKLFAQAKKLSPDAFRSDPYLKNVLPKEKQIGDFLLTTAHYERGEFFQYDMPCMRDEIVVPKIGFFPEKVEFPALYKKNIPWVSVCPSEVFSMAPDIPEAKGKVLVLGLGLGYYPYRICENDEVESITIVEKSPEVIRLFREEILPHFSNKKPIRVVTEDAFSFLERVRPGDFDFCYADIWEGWADGAECMEKILPHEKRLPECRFSYWIRDEILWFRENGEGANR